MENIGRHYSHTLKAWYDNFQKNKSKPEVAKYPARLHRLWDIFLAWSVVAAGQVRARLDHFKGYRCWRATEAKCVP